MILLPLNMLYNFLSTFYLKHFTIQLVNKNCQQKKYLAGIFKQYCLINIVDIYHYHENTKPLTNKMTQNKKHPTSCRIGRVNAWNTEYQMQPSKGVLKIHIFIFIFICSYLLRHIFRTPFPRNTSGYLLLEYPILYQAFFQTSFKHVQKLNLKNSQTQELKYS